MSHATMEGVTKSNRWLKGLYFVSLLASAAVFLGYATYSLMYTPETQRMLLNQLGGVYVGEDLSATNVTEGQVKQFAYKSIMLAFDYDYLSFVEDRDYADLVSGKVDSDMPDHRDKLRSTFSDEARLKVIEQLWASAWMNRFHQQRRYIDVSFNSPPIQEGAVGWKLSATGRLNIAYKGSFFISVNSYGFKSQRFKINYDIALERRPLLLGEQESTYYFGPMVEPALFEWHVSDLSWTVEQRG